MYFAIHREFHSKTYIKRMHIFLCNVFQAHKLIEKQGRRDLCLNASESDKDLGGRYAWAPHLSKMNLGA